MKSSLSSFFFFFNDTATTEIYTLSLHDALPISSPTSSIFRCRASPAPAPARRSARAGGYVSADRGSPGDRKSTRLNSSHSQISYAVFCLKKKKRRHDDAGRRSLCLRPHTPHYRL